jgi:protein-S-isoprenylcysteine O-methyltransferase Ste14
MSKKRQMKKRGSPNSLFQTVVLLLKEDSSSKLWKRFFDMKNSPPAKSRVIVRMILGLLVILALLFVPAGTLRWPEAWVFLLLYFSSVAGAFLWMKAKAPDLLKERMSRKKDAKSWDTGILGLYTFFLIGMIVVAGLDAVRFAWSRVPWALEALGFLGYIPAMALLFRVLTQNPFLSEKVRIQTDRGQFVCTTGPYRYVRHPMYAGIVLFVFCIPLSLGSFYALIPAAGIAFLFVLRTSLEDKTLHRELPGYREYAQRVRFRLIPGIW